MLEIIKQLYKEKGTISVNQMAHKQDYPYTTYNIIRFETKADHTHIKTVDDRERHMLQPQVILSINAYSNNMIEAIKEAEDMRDYFKYHAVFEDAVVVDAGDIENRTVTIVDGIEYRYGFDVWIRVRKDVKVESLTIEEYKLEVKNE